jgi:hypothetical protein
MNNWEHNQNKKRVVVLLMSILVTVFSVSSLFFYIEPANAADTGFLSPTANAAVAGQGDGDGYATTPTNAYADAGGSAVDTNSGVNTNNTCTVIGADKHVWSTYSISIPAGSTINGIEVRQDLAVDSLTDAPFSCVSLSWDGGTTWTTPQSVTLTATAETTYTYGGVANLWGRTWAISEFTNANFRVRITNGDTANNRSNRDFSLDWIPVRVTYTAPTSTYTQSAYRFFANVDSTDVGTALAAQDTAATLTSTGQAFRLRALVHIGTLNLGINGNNFKLQYVDRGTGSCAVPAGGTPAAYTDVSTTTQIAYKDNTPADGAALTANGSDPTHGADTIVNQTYEEANNFTNSQGAINIGQDGKWDFALYDYDAFSNTTYCFRIVNSDGTALNTYSVYPTITTATKACTEQLIGSNDGATSVSLYEIAPKTAATKFLVTPTIAFQSWGAARRASDGLVFLVQYGGATNRLYSQNLTTGVTTDIGSMGIGAANLVRLAFDSAGVLWGMDSAANGVLYRINTATGLATVQCAAVTGISTGGDIAFSTTGTLYAMTGNSLYTINTTACTATLIGASGVTNLPSMAFNASNVLYAFRYGVGTQQLYTINTGTGVGTLIGTFSPGQNFYDAATCPNSAPNAPTLVSPASGAFISDNTPTLSANYSDPDTGDTGTTGYRIATSAANCLAGTVVASGTSALTLSNNESTTWTPGSSIGIDGVYYWCAQNNDGFLTSAWTTMGSFTLDTTPPTVSATSIQSLTTMTVTFSEAMGAGVTTAANFTITESGKGTLADHPNTVTLVSGNTYLLTWTSGSMVNAADTTVTVANAQDVAGNVIGTPNFGHNLIRGIIHFGTKVKDIITAVKYHYRFH